MSPIMLPMIAIASTRDMYLRTAAADWKQQEATSPSHGQKFGEAVRLPLDRCALRTRWGGGFDDGMSVTP